MELNMICGTDLPILPTYIPESMSEKCHGNDIPNEKTVLLLEPFYGGSHKQLIDTLINGNI